MLRLRTAVKTADPGAFAVLDGVRFDDVAPVRCGARLVAHPLFLDHAGCDLAEARPLLADLSQRPGILDVVLAWSAARGCRTLAEPRVAASI